MEIQQEQNMNQETDQEQNKVSNQNQEVNRDPKEKEEALQISEDLLDFLQASPTAFQAVDQVRKRLTEAGYRELYEGSDWDLQPNGLYFVLRNESSILAFRTPADLKHLHGFQIAASHSDSPAFKVKANPEMTEAGAYTMLNVEKYGGMLMRPWFDRPLSMAGRLLVEDGDNGIRTILVNIDRDLCLIPSLAIHMDREANKGHDLNPQKELLPIFGDEKAKGRLKELLAEEAGVKPDQILGHDLFLYVRGRGSIWGADQEYVSAGHLDDLQCGFANLKGFIKAGEDDDRNLDDTVPVLAIFDNEEVGSGTKQGADSTFLSDTLWRIAEAAGLKESDFHRAIANSFMLSCDNAHAVHPNYSDKADPVNRPLMNHGIVMKYNANQKYTTDGVSAAVFRNLCRKLDLSLQEFTNRSDMAGGSTLGNISNAHISLNTVDIGLPQLSMHSPYETAGVYDTLDLIRLTHTFFQSRFSDLGGGKFRMENEWLKPAYGEICRN